MVSQEKYDELERRNIDLESKYDKLFSLFAYLRRMIFGRKSERQVNIASDLQGTLFELEPSSENDTAEKERITYERSKKTDKSSHPGRNPFTEDLPAEETTFLHPMADTSSITKIGEDTSEQLSMKPALMFVKRFIYPKYKDPVTGLIYQAPAVNNAFSRFKVDEQRSPHCQYWK